MQVRLNVCSWHSLFQRTHTLLGSYKGITTRIISDQQSVILVWSTSDVRYHNKEQDNNEYHETRSGR